LLLAWKEFLSGKNSKIGVPEFKLKLMDNLISLHNDLKNKTYIHDQYEKFNVFEPKKRDIHKATVRDRVLHRPFIEFSIPFLIINSFLIHILVV